MKRRILEVSLYAFGQGLGYATDLLLFMTAMAIHPIDSPILAHLCGKFGSAAITFPYHARVSFPGDKANTFSSSALAYVATVGANIAFTSLALKAALSIFPGAPLYWKIASDVLGVVLTYALMRTAVFPRTVSH